MHTIQAVLLLVLVTGISIYDHHKQHVPNSVTLTLLFGGLLAYFPGEIETWLGCTLLFLIWRLGGIGGGDAKLWMGMLWLVPPHHTSIGGSVMLVSFLMTAILQMGWRKLNGQPLTGVRTPGAWRVIPFVAWFLLAGIHVH